MSAEVPYGALVKGAYRQVDDKTVQLVQFVSTPPDMSEGVLIDTVPVFDAESHKPKGVRERTIGVRVLETCVPVSIESVDPELLELYLTFYAQFTPNPPKNPEP